MPYDFHSKPLPRHGSLRRAVLELMTEAEQDPSMSDADYLDGLRMLVTGSQSRAEELWTTYRGSRDDTRSAAFARYGY